MTTKTCTTATTHCESCGSTDPEDVGMAALRENYGYTSCCNELPADQHGCRGHHLDLNW